MMWRYGTIDGFQYEAKVYDNPSIFGINQGRISKLYIYGKRGKILAMYERGWSGDNDDGPQGKLGDVVKKILRRYPGRLPKLKREKQDKRLPVYSMTYVL